MIKSWCTANANYGVIPSEQLRSPRSAQWQRNECSNAYSELSAAGINLDEAIITLKELYSQMINQGQRKPYIMPTKTDLMEFLQEGDDINEDDRLGTS